MSAFESQMGLGGSGMLKPEYLVKLQEAEKDGLVKLTGMTNINFGQTILTVTATRKLQQLSDAKASDTNSLAIQVGTIKVLDIIGEEPCKLKMATPGDEFRLIVGLVNDTPTDAVKTLGPKYGTIEPHRLKFRAILQFNPFNRSYSYRVADIGYPDKPEWLSENVSQIIRN